MKKLWENLLTPSIVAGASLAQGNLLKSLKNTRLYGISLVKLVAIPLLQ